ncbi:MAG: hypothetical protein Q8P12_05940 [bacterium]|nr:hypothetical protein [bacterium]
MSQNGKMVALAADEDDLACQALRILEEEGAEILFVGGVPQQPVDGHVVFTSRNLPHRFPGAHLRHLGDTVFVRENSHKDSRNPDGFRVAVVEMGRRLKLLETPKKEQKSRRPRGPYRWPGKRREYGVVI